MPPPIRLKPCPVCGGRRYSSQSTTCSAKCRDELRRRLKWANPPPPVPGARWVALGRGHWALVDAEDFDRVVVHEWCMNARGYAQCTNTRRAIRKCERLHVFILDPERKHPAGVDHRNGDTLDCRKDNLHYADQTINNRNKMKSDGKSSRFKGVSRVRHRWAAQISVMGQFEFA